MVSTANGKAETQALAVTYRTHDDKEVSLSLADIRRYLCPRASEQEAYVFLRLCESQGLNPFVRDVYLIKYSDNQPATMVVGKDAFTKRAERHPQFDGYRAGVIVLRGDALEYLTASFAPPKTTLFGGWAEVFRKDRAQPIRAEIAKDEYETGQSSWKRMAGTMCRKVALVQALREAFPQSFSGLYDASEMEQSTSADLSAAVGYVEPAAPEADAQPKRITDAQRRRLFALTKQHGVSEDALRARLQQTCHTSHTSEITPEQYEAVCAWVEAQTPAPAQTPTSVDTETGEIVEGEAREVVEEEPTAAAAGATAGAEPAAAEQAEQTEAAPVAPPPANNGGTPTTLDELHEAIRQRGWTVKQVKTGLDGRLPHEWVGNYQGAMPDKPEAEIIREAWTKLLIENA